MDIEEKGEIEKQLSVVDVCIKLKGEFK